MKKRIKIKQQHKKDKLQANIRKLNNYYRDNRIGSYVKLNNDYNDNDIDFYIKNSPHFIAQDIYYTMKAKVIDVILKYNDKHAFFCQIRFL